MVTPQPQCLITSNSPHDRYQFPFQITALNAPLNVANVFITLKALTLHINGMWNVEQSVERDAARPRPQHGTHQYVINASQSASQPTSYTQLTS